MSSGPIPPQAPPLAFVRAIERRERLQIALRGLGRTWGEFRHSYAGMAGLIILATFIVLALLAPWLAIDDPESLLNLHEPLLRPGGPYVLGTDSIGRDIFSVFIYGARISLLVGFAASFLSTLLGTAVGLVAGFYGRVADESLMRTTDFFLVLPWLPFMIVLTYILGPSLFNVIFVIGITSWPSTARVIRSQVLSIKERGFVERAHAVGARSSHIVSRHVLPSVFPLVFANAILTVAWAIFTESFLAYLGLGTGLSWGKMIDQAYGQGAFVNGYYWYYLPPTLAIVLVILGFTMVGFTLDRILNPRLRRR